MRIIYPPPRCPDLLDMALDAVAVAVEIVRRRTRPRRSRRRNLRDTR